MPSEPKIEISEDVNAEHLNTLAVPARIRYLIIVRNDDEMKEAVRFAKQKRMPVFPLGDGSNIVIEPPELNVVAIKFATEGIKIVSPTKTHTDVTVEAGHNWDKFVQWTIARNLAGIESTTIVPGTVGAAPVQNVGCYGQEVSETITEVEAYDTEREELVTLQNSECRFEYRDSLFKHPRGKQYVITRVTFRLIPGDTAPTPEYITLQAELHRRGITGRPTLEQIREALIAVRTGRLPDPGKIPTAGSFFHNPIVAPEEYQSLATEYPEMPHWPTSDAKVKLSAPWLIEAVGLKGFERDGVAIYPKQAVVLINPGHRPAADLLSFRDFVVGKVKKKFGIELLMEPELVTNF